MRILTNLLSKHVQMVVTELEEKERGDGFARVLSRSYREILAKLPIRLENDS